MRVDNICRHKASRTLYYRPVQAESRRTYRSLKTKNLKLAMEKFYKLQACLGNVTGNLLRSRLAFARGA